MERHLQVLLHALGRLLGSPVATLMTAAVIGIALALPAGLYVVLDNARQLSGQWQQGTQISLFLKQDLEEGKGKELAARLAGRERIAEAGYISPEQALGEFRQFSGFGDALESLESNPLPGVVMVQPAVREPGAVQQLLEQLQELPEVEMAQLDMEWVKRLHGIIDIIQRAILIMAGLLALAVLLIVGNTIRLDIENRRDEIVITKLIGASDGFIRRPFLYTGFWYGLGGALIALLLVNLSLALLQRPVLRLAGLYGSDFQLGFTGPQTVLVLLTAGIALGLLGALLAVGRHLRAIEPE
ncbi:MAG TPA: FtsX-like permease family protein [Gammaproteobacteria bacterium]|nr:FtsX-like permease family protein [Gammaproteobacteria bacterium]